MTKKDFQSAKRKALDIMATIALQYHNTNHVLGVYESAMTLCDAEKISEGDKDLVAITALYHDTGYSVCIDNHEIAGAEMAEAVLPGFGYGPKEVGTIMELILATRFPQTPNGELERIMCDSDLAHLGSGNLIELGESLRGELKIEEREWQAIQVNFLKAHSYFTFSANNLFNEQKRKNLDAYERLLGFEDVRRI